MIDSGGFFPFEGDIIVIEYGLILYCFNFNPDFTDQHWISLRDSYGILGWWATIYNFTSIVWTHATNDLIVE